MICIHGFPLQGVISQEIKGGAPNTFTDGKRLSIWGLRLGSDKDGVRHAACGVRHVVLGLRRV